MRRLFLPLAFPLLLMACTAESVWAPDEAVQRAAYHHTAPTSITLITMINNRSQEGAHSALLINGSQRVVFDPAGSWWHRYAPERNDLHYGMTPTMMKFYVDYHARETYHVVMQTVEVSPEVAEKALRISQQYGAVPKAFCGRSTSQVLRQLPGFETVPRTFYPGRIMRGFAKVPGVTVQRIYDDDPDDNGGVLRDQNRVQVADWAATQPNK